LLIFQHLKILYCKSIIGDLTVLVVL